MLIGFEDKPVIARREAMSFGEEEEEEEVRSSLLCVIERAKLR